MLMRRHQDEHRVVARGFCALAPKFSSGKAAGARVVGEGVNSRPKLSHGQNCYL